MSDYIMPRGGKREGAGRKANPVKTAPIAQKCVATRILSGIDEVRFWNDLLFAKDLRIRLESAKYLTDKRDGRAKQAVEHSGPDGGPIEHAVVLDL